MPDLAPGHQLGALARGAGANAENLGPLAYGCRIERRATVSAKRLSASATAFRRFDIDPRDTGNDPEVPVGSRNSNPKRRTRQRLAIRAMANSDPRRINLGLIGDISAVAGAFILFHPPVPPVVSL